MKNALCRWFAHSSKANAESWVVKSCKSRILSFGVTSSLEMVIALSAGWHYSVAQPNMHARSDRWNCPPYKKRPDIKLLYIISVHGWLFFVAIFISFCTFEKASEFRIFNHCTVNIIKYLTYLRPRIWKNMQVGSCCWDRYVIKVKCKLVCN